MYVHAYMNVLQGPDWHFLCDDKLPISFILCAGQAWSDSLSARDGAGVSCRSQPVTPRVHGQKQIESLERINSIRETNVKLSTI